MSEYLPGGNPLSYWQRPFGERWKHWARPGIRIWVPRKGRLVLVWDGEKEVNSEVAAEPVQDVSRHAISNVSSGEKSDKVSNGHVPVLSCSDAHRRTYIGVQKRSCEECGKPLPEGSATQRRFCSDACRKRASRYSECNLDT